MAKSVQDLLLKASTQVGIIVTDLEGIITVFNTGAEFLLGYQAEEVIARKTPLIFHNPSELEAHEKLLTTAFGKSIKGFDIFTVPVSQGLYETQRWTYHDKQGNPFKVQLSITPIQDAAGKITGMLFMVTPLSRPQTSLPEFNAEVTYTSLNDLPSAKQFSQIMETEIRRMRRENNPISLLMMDVDDFKEFYDLYGKAMTEHTLEKIAYLLMHRIRRAGDFLAYYGNYQFAVLLPNTDHNSTIKVAEQLRLMISELKIEHVNSTVCPYVTVSLGIANTHPDKSTTSAMLFNKANMALQQAKKDGKNCSRIFS